MSQSLDQYVPRFPHAHALLLEVYKNAMKCRGNEGVIWCERFASLKTSWEVLKDEGLLPPLFTEHFWEDVQNVMIRISEDVAQKKLTERQNVMTFAIASLRNSFGGQ